MLARIIFISVVIIATLVVIFLALFSPFPGQDKSEALVSLSLYVQQLNARPPAPAPAASPQQDLADLNTKAFVFQRALTEGPEDTSQMVGRVQGFIIPEKRLASLDTMRNLDPNLMYLTFETGERLGSLSVQANAFKQMDGEVLDVVGGTGSFAFARGVAIVERDDRDAAYRVKLRLRFPDGSQAIPA